MNDLRDRILTAIREADSHSCMYGEGTDAGGLADAVMAVLEAERGGTCDASTVTDLGLVGARPLSARASSATATTGQSTRRPAARSGGQSTAAWSRRRSP